MKYTVDLINLILANANDCSFQVITTHCKCSTNNVDVLQIARMKWRSSENYPRKFHAHCAMLSGCERRTKISKLKLRAKTLIGKHLFHHKMYTLTLSVDLMFFNQKLPSDPLSVGKHFQVGEIE